MAVLPVIKYGHPTLRVKAERFVLDALDESFIDDMIETMEKLDGVGLAATQVDVRKQLIVAKDPDRKKLYVLLNPVIVAVSERRESEIEGCLSLPGLQAEVSRPARIIVQAQTREGEKVEISAKGMFARVLQHEIDHLHGVLYIDRADPQTLAWVVAGNEEEELQPAELAAIQQEFRRRYHHQTDSLRFDPLPAV